MKILIDTNIILEIILHREYYDVANRLLLALQEGKHKLYITSGCFYGLLFTTDKYLRKVLEMKNPRRTDTLRLQMTQVLNVVDVAGQDKQSLLRGIQDMEFNDLEDSCQHQAAHTEMCDYLLTFNVQDYTGATIPVLSPQEFMNRLL